MGGGGFKCQVLSGTGETFSSYLLLTRPVGASAASRWVVPLLSRQLPQRSAKVQVICCRSCPVVIARSVEQCTNMFLRSAPAAR